MIIERQFSTLSRYNHDLKDPTYQTIIRVMQELWNRGLLQRFDGECIAASDILQHALSQAGISSRLVEVQLSIVSQDPRSGMVWKLTLSPIQRHKMTLSIRTSLLRRVLSKVSSNLLQPFHPLHHFCKLYFI